MQRFSAWARWIATVILIPIFTAVAARFIWEQPRETANAVLKFLLDLSEQTWFRVTALLLVGFVAGLWLDWLLRKLDRSRAEKRKALGTEMVFLGHELRKLVDPNEVRPKIMSRFATARKLGIWVPDQRVFEIADNQLVQSSIRNLIIEYLMDVGTMLKDGHSREAKQQTVKSKAAFDEAYATYERFRRRRNL